MQAVRCATHCKVKTNAVPASTYKTDGEKVYTTGTCAYSSGMTPKQLAICGSCVQ
jgi:hypothetical protein